MTDAVETKHPDYQDRIEEWRMMRACQRGTKAIKEARDAYLPIPSGFGAQPDGGVAYYGAYLGRAQFPDILKPTLSGMVGLMHGKVAEVELPSGLEPMREIATSGRHTLEVFHQRITTELLLQGRFSILADVPEEGADVPFLAGYEAEDLINWGEDGTLFVLDESGLVRDGFTWSPEKMFRVLERDPLTGAYRVTVWKDGNERVIEPRARANRPLSGIPFVVAGATDLSIRPEDPPLIGVAEASIAVYRLDADYRHQLFFSGQETAYVTGIGKEEKLPTVLGSGVTLGFENKDAKVGYITPQCTGIDAHRQAIMDGRDNAVGAGIKLFDTQGKSAESGEALRLRLGAQTATLTTVAKTTAAALERALRHCAEFIGADPNAVKVKPNLEFVKTLLDPVAAKALMELWMGDAISYATLFQNMQRGGIVSPDRTQAQEESEIETGHKPPDVTPPGGLPVDPNAAAGFA